MDLWESLLLKLEKEVGRPRVDQWLKPLNIKKFDAGNIFLEGNPLEISWFEEHIRPILKKSPLLNQNGRIVRIHLQNSTQKEVAIAPTAEMKFSHAVLDPTCTFDHFVWDPASSLFKQALKESFNPIYLYGPKGAGKSHLLMAIAQEKREKAFYITAEQFTSHVVQAIRNSQMQAFRNFYRKIECFLVDNIHELEGKAATQEEFFHTFNTLHTLGKQIILASSSPPSKLKGIEPRLVSRFEWGICIKIEKVDSSLLVIEKAKSLDLHLKDDVVEFLAKSFSNDPVTPLQALSLRSSHPYTIESCKIVLKDFLESIKGQQITLEEILKTVASTFDLSTEEILGKSQTKTLSLARQICMYLLRSKLRLPFQTIGKAFKRDHSTVMSSIKNIESLLEKNDSQIYSLFEKINLV
jgi:chromosomal replication initiator protein